MTLKPPESCHVCRLEYWDFYYVSLGLPKGFMMGHTLHTQDNICTRLNLAYFIFLANSKNSSEAGLKQDNT